MPYFSSGSTSRPICANTKLSKLALTHPYIGKHYLFYFQSGFSFDRSCNRDESLRSTLDDLAKRHPELAEHLDTFAHHRGGSPRSRRLADDDGDDDADFDGRFEGAFREPFGGGFPFGGRDRPRADEFVRRFREPRRASGDSPGTSRPEHAPPPEDTAPEGADRTDSVNPGQSESASKPRSTIQQSNTIDLGQRQEAVDDRNQRSMSAPPTEKGQRYTSSINIPVNQPAADMAEPEHRPHAAAPAAQEAAKPVERIIPIQIEGRDEPVVPRKAAAAAASFSQPPPRAEKIFGQRPEQFTQYLNREHFPDMWRGFPPEEPPPARRQEEQPKPPSPPPPPPPPENKTLAAIEQIQVIQKDVSALMEQAQKFDGLPRDKHYLYLDEMLTRNLIKLDNIDTQGQDMIRSSRKEAIKCIEKAIGILETKAALNAEGGEQKAPAAEEEKPAAASEGGEAEAAPPESEAAEESTTDFVLVTEEKQKPAEEDSSKEETAEEKKD